MILSQSVLSKIGVNASPKNPTHPGDVLLTRRELAALLGVAHRTVGRWVESGRLVPRHKVRNGQSWFAWADLREVMREVIALGLFEPLRSREKMGPKKPRVSK